MFQSLLDATGLISFVHLLSCVSAVMREGRFLPPLTHLVKSAGTVSLIKLSAVLNVVHSIYIRKFSLKDNAGYRVWFYLGLRLERDRGRSREKEWKNMEKERQK